MSLPGDLERKIRPRSELAYESIPQAWGTPVSLRSFASGLPKTSCHGRTRSNRPKRRLSGRSRRPAMDRSAHRGFGEGLESRGLSETLLFAPKLRIAFYKRPLVSYTHLEAETSTSRLRKPHCTTPHRSCASLPGQGRASSPGPVFPRGAGSPVCTSTSAA